MEAREASDLVKINENRRQNAGADSRRQNTTPTAGTFTTGSKNAPPDNIRCVYCGGLHYSASCEEVVGVKERRGILYKEGRCYNCIRKGRQMKNCRNTKLCRYCSGGHPQFICPSQTAKYLDQEERRSETDIT